jgi:membrane associated rhomboid family serine protease
MRGNSIINDLRSTFSRDNNSLNQLILVNVLVFLVLSVVAVIVALFQLEAGWYLRISRYLAVPASLGNLLYRPWSLFTYMFVHAGFFHILFNMLWLYWIGQIFQEYLGSKKLVDWQGPLCTSWPLTSSRCFAASSIPLLPLAPLLRYWPWW